MPFNGKGQRDLKENWNYTRILEEIKTKFDPKPIISEISSRSEEHTSELQSR